MIRTLHHRDDVLTSRRDVSLLLLVAYAVVCGILAVWCGLMLGRLVGGRWGASPVMVELVGAGAFVTAAGFAAGPAVDALWRSWDGWCELRHREVAKSRSARARAGTVRAR
jgi:hypothetical protein